VKTLLLVAAALLGAGMARAGEPREGSASASAPGAPREVIVNNDCQSGMFGGGFSTKQQLQQFVDEFRGTQVTGLEWSICGPIFFTDTKVGDLYGDGIRADLWPTFRKGDKVVSDTLHRRRRSDAGRRESARASRESRTLQPAPAEHLGARATRCPLVRRWCRRRRDLQRSGRMGYAPSPRQSGEGERLPGRA
jgi:hypothetical protein